MTTTTAPSPSISSESAAAQARAIHLDCWNLLDELEARMEALATATWGPDGTGSCPAPDGTSRDFLVALERIRVSAISICEPVKDLADPGLDAQPISTWRAA